MVAPLGLLQHFHKKETWFCQAAAFSQEKKKNKTKTVSAALATLSLTSLAFSNSYKY